MGKNGWDARVKKYGLEKALEQLSDARSKGSEVRHGVRQERADENLQILESLVQSGEPFWIKAKKGDITAVRGQQLFRSSRKNKLGHFPTIQAQHGTFEALEELFYGEIPYGTNKVLDYTTYGSEIEEVPSQRPIWHALALRQ